MRVCLVEGGEGGGAGAVGVVEGDAGLGDAVVEVDAADWSGGGVERGAEQG
jgi:hypothetical protein